MNTNSDGESNVVQLRPVVPALLVAGEWSERELEAHSLAMLSALPALEYERTRVQAAKELKCRVSWLDKIIEGIREKAAAIAHCPPAKDGRNSVGYPINFVYNDGTEVMGFLVAACHYNGKDRHIIVLADGNATTVNSVPLSADYIANLQASQTVYE